jgi:hypothetical protein
MLQELLERPMRTASPVAGMLMVVTSARGLRSDIQEMFDWVRVRPGRRGGDEGRMPVDDVGTGVG